MTPSGVAMVANKGLWTRCINIVLLLGCVVEFLVTPSKGTDENFASSQTTSNVLTGPIFTSSFDSDDVIYANTRGVVLPCSAYGRPMPAVSWVWTDGVSGSTWRYGWTGSNSSSMGSAAAAATSGSAASFVDIRPVSGFVDVLSNGSLYFLPFHDSMYDEQVHSKSRVRCRASNSVGTVLSKELTVRAVLVSHYQTFNVQVNDVYVTSGNTAVVQCSVEPYYVRDYVTVTSWTQNGVAVKTGGRFSILSNGDLHIRDVTVDDSFQPLRCTTTNQLTGERKTSVSATLFVIDPVSSAPSVKDAPTVVNAHQGASVELPCVASAYPLPKYTWSRDGSIVPEAGNGTGRSRARQNGGNLILDDVTFSDAGEFVCTTENNLGSRTTSVRLEIKGRLHVYIEPLTQAVNVGDDAVFTCVISGYAGTSREGVNQDDVNVAWYRNGLLVDVTSSASKTSVTEMTLSDSSKRVTLSVQTVGRTDAGMYQCLAVVGDGGNEQAAAQLIIEAAKPYIYKRLNPETIAPGGSPVSLSCAAAGSPSPSITWSLDGQPIGSISSDSRYVVGSSVTADGDVIGYVNISRVGVADGGLYTCTAENRVGRETVEGKLLVHGIPYVRPMGNVSAVAGRQVVIRCYVAGYPVQSITWYKDGSKLPVNHRQNVQPGGTLYIDNIDRVADQGRYACDARDTNGQGMRRDFYVSVLEPPIIDSFGFPRRKQYDRVSVSCVVSQGDLPIVITWSKDGAPLPAHLGIVIQKTGDYSSLLSVGNVDQRHSGNYTCTATNAAASFDYTAQLNVDVPPTWLSEPQNSMVVLGRRVIIECRVTGDPSPTVVWKKDFSDGKHTQRGNYRQIGLIKDDDSSRIRQLSDGSLLIDDATRADAGYYLCQASNGVGSDLSKVLHLTVHIPAKFQSAVVNYTVHIGESVDLECIAEGDLPLSVAWSPKQGSVDWQHNTRLKQSYFEPAIDSQSLSDVGGGISTSGHRGARLSVLSAQREDTGFYVCTSQNEYGSDTLIMRLVVLEPPDPPVKLQVIDVTSRTVELEWNVQFDGNSPITHSLIDIDSIDILPGVDTPMSLRVNGTNRSVTVNGLHPSVTYVVRLRVGNRLGLSNFSQPGHFVTLEEEPSASPANFSVVATSSQSLKVFWKAPSAEHLNGKLLGYYVGYKRFNVSAPYRYIGKSVQSDVCDLTELDKFTVYSVHVQAYNAKGPGPRTEDFIVMTLEDVPSQPPTDINIVPMTSQSLSVSWSPPLATTIHGVLQGYTIIYRSVRDDEDETDDKTIVKSTNERNVTIYGLRKYTNYSIQILALTRAGHGIASKPVFVRTLPDFPDKPADIKAVPAGPNSVLVAWRPPLHINGILTKYTLHIQDLTVPATPDVIIDYPATTHSHLVTNLTTNYRYGFSVSASTSRGEGEKTRQVTLSTVDKVSAQIASFPLKINAKGHDTMTLPCIAVGMPQPQIVWRRRSEPVIVNERIRLLDDGSLAIDDVRSADAGEYTCRAENEHGADEITVTLSVQAAPQAPVLSVAMTSSTSVQVTWRTGNNGGSPIQGFVLYIRREHDGGEPSLRQFGPSNRSYTANNLRCGSRYSFMLRAFNRIGEGRSSETVVAITNGSAPIMPPQSMILYSVNATSATLAMGTWETGGCPITSFDVDLQVMGHNIWKNVQRNISPNVTFYDVIDLHPSSWYNIRITAHNDAGSTECLVRFSTQDYYVTNGNRQLSGLGPPRLFDVHFDDSHAASNVKGGDITRPFYERVEMIVPVCAVVVISLVGCVVMAICWRSRMVKRRIKDRQATTVKMHQDLNSDALMMLASDKYKTHDAVVSCSQSRDFARTYVPEPCGGRRCGSSQDSNSTLLLRPAPVHHVTDDVTDYTVPPSISDRPASETVPTDNEHEADSSDSDLSEPYIFRDRQVPFGRSWNPAANSVTDVGDSGVDDVMNVYSVSSGGSNNNHRYSASRGDHGTQPPGHVTQSRGKTSGVGGACSSLSSGTDDEGNINPYATFPLPRHLLDWQQNGACAASSSEQQQQHQQQQSEDGIRSSSSAATFKPRQMAAHTGSATQPAHTAGIILNPRQYRLPSHCADNIQYGAVEVVSEVAANAKRRSVPPPPIRRTPSIKASMSTAVLRQQQQPTGSGEVADTRTGLSTFAVPIPVPPTVGNGTVTSSH